MEYKWKICLIFFVGFIGKAMAQPVCHEDQYEFEDRCCYACDPGSRVYKDCQASPYEQTSCGQCAKTTFHRGLNRHKHCTPCTRCDAERGLRLKRICTETSDALCATLDGYFCRDPLEGGCRAAQRHSVRCSAGHHIGQKGTADKDTECLKCIHGTFSNGTLTSCQPHTKCESLDLDQIQPGTDSTDSECGKHGSNVTPAMTRIIIIIIPIVVLVLFVVLVVFLSCLKRMNQAQKERSTFQHSAVQTQDVAPGEPNEEKNTMLQNLCCGIMYWVRKS
uniref:TNFR-Cys domain-containing protein n=1 Tax=Gadus morhua TaxID=8049 RepID=A0A8C5C7P4_GADMO